MIKNNIKVNSFYQLNIIIIAIIIIIIALYCEFFYISAS